MQDDLRASAGLFCTASTQSNISSTSGLEGLAWRQLRVDGLTVASITAAQSLWRTAFAERVLPRASDLWVQASLDYKQRLQQLFFPEGDRVRRNSIQSNRRTGATFQLLGAV
jgi:hypothetical protein